MLVVDLLVKITVTFSGLNGKASVCFGWQRIHCL